MTYPADSSMPDQSWPSPADQPWDQPAAPAFDDLAAPTGPPSAWAPPVDEPVEDDSRRSRRARARNIPAPDKPAERSGRGRRAGNDSPASPAPARGRRSKSDDSGDVVLVVPVLTSFDFLEGSYQKVINSRLVTMVVAGVFALASIVMVGVGLRARLSASGLQGQVTSLNTNNAALAKQLGKANDYTGPGGQTYSGATMQSDIAARSTAVRTAVGSAADIPAIMAALQSLAGTGVTISAINIAPPPTVGAPPTTVPSVTTTVASNTPSTTTTTLPPGVPVTVSAIATSNQALTNFITTATRTHFLTNVNITYSGAAPSLTASVTATVLLSAVPSPLPTVLDTTTTTTTTTVPAHG